MQEERVKMDRAMSSSLFIVFFLKHTINGRIIKSKVVPKTDKGTFLPTSSK